MIALLPPYGDYGVATLGEGVRQKEFQLSHLVPPQLGPACGVVPLDVQPHVQLVQSRQYSAVRATPVAGAARSGDLPRTVIQKVDGRREVGEVQAPAPGDIRQYTLDVRRGAVGVRGIHTQGRRHQGRPKSGRRRG